MLLELRSVAKCCVLLGAIEIRQNEAAPLAQYFGGLTPFDLIIDEGGQEPDVAVILDTKGNEGGNMGTQINTDKNSLKGSYFGPNMDNSMHLDGVDYSFLTADDTEPAVLSDEVSPEPQGESETEVEEDQAQESSSSDTDYTRSGNHDVIWTSESDSEGHGSEEEEEFSPWKSMDWEVSTSETEDVIETNKEEIVLKEEIDPWAGQADDPWQQMSWAEQDTETSPNDPWKAMDWGSDSQDEEHDDLEDPWKTMDSWEVTVADHSPESLNPEDAWKVLPWSSQKTEVSADDPSNPWKPLTWETSAIIDGKDPTQQSKAHQNQEEGQDKEPKEHFVHIDKEDETTLVWESKPEDGQNNYSGNGNYDPSDKVLIDFNAQDDIPQTRLAKVSDGASWSYLNEPPKLEEADNWSPWKRPDWMETGQSDSLSWEMAEDPSTGVSWMGADFADQLEPSDDDEEEDEDSEDENDTQTPRSKKLNKKARRKEWKARQKEKRKQAQLALQRQQELQDLKVNEEYIFEGPLLEELEEEHTDIDTSDLKRQGSKILDPVYDYEFLREQFIRTGRLDAYNDEDTIKIIHRVLDTAVEENIILSLDNFGQLLSILIRIVSLYKPEDNGIYAELIDELDKEPESDSIYAELDTLLNSEVEKWSRESKDNINDVIDDDDLKRQLDEEYIENSDSIYAELDAELNNQVESDDNDIESDVSDDPEESIYAQLDAELNSYNNLISELGDEPNSNDGINTELEEATEEFDEEPEEPQTDSIYAELDAELNSEVEDWSSESMDNINEVLDDHEFNTQNHDSIYAELDAELNHQIDDDIDIFENSDSISYLPYLEEAMEDEEIEEESQTDSIYAELDAELNSEVEDWSSESMDNFNEVLDHEFNTQNHDLYAELDAELHNQIDEDTDPFDEDDFNSQNHDSIYAELDAELNNQIDEDPDTLDSEESIYAELDAELEKEADMESTASEPSSPREPTELAVAPFEPFEIPQLPPLQVLKDNFTPAAFHDLIQYGEFSSLAEAPQQLKAPLSPQQIKENNRVTYEVSQMESRVPQLAPPPKPIEEPERAVVPPEVEQSESTSMDLSKYKVFGNPQYTEDTERFTTAMDFFREDDNGELPELPNEPLDKILSNTEYVTDFIKATNGQLPTEQSNNAHVSATEGETTHEILSQIETSLSGLDTDLLYSDNELTSLFNEIVAQQEIMDNILSGNDKLDPPKEEIETIEEKEEKPATKLSSIKPPKPFITEEREDRRTPKKPPTEERDDRRTPKKPTMKPAMRPQISIESGDSKHPVKYQAKKPPRYENSLGKTLHTKSQQKAPESNASKQKAPESKAPESKAPESKAPESKATKQKAPESKLKKLLWNAAPAITSITAEKILEASKAFDLSTTNNHYNGHQGNKKHHQVSVNKPVNLNKQFTQHSAVAAFNDFHPPDSPFFQSNDNNYNIPKDTGKNTDSEARDNQNINYVKFDSPTDSINSYPSMPSNEKMLPYNMQMPRNMQQAKALPSINNNNRPSNKIQPQQTFDNNVGLVSGENILNDISYISDGNYKIKLTFESDENICFKNLVAGDCDVMNPGIRLEADGTPKVRLHVDLDACMPPSQGHDLDSLNEAIPIHYDLTRDEKIIATYNIAPHTNYKEDYIVDFETQTGISSQLALNGETGALEQINNNIQFNFNTFRNDKFKQKRRNNEVSLPGDKTCMEIAPVTGFSRSKMLSIPEVCTLTDLGNNKQVILWDMNQITNGATTCVNGVKLMAGTGVWRFSLNLAELSGNYQNNADLVITCNMRLCNNKAGNPCSDKILACGY